MLMKICVDYDDCLCETGKAFPELVARLFGKTVPYEEMRYFNLQQSFDLTDDQYEQLLREGNAPEMLLSFEETPGASVVLNEWLLRGYEVSVITGRPYSSYQASRIWLDGHRMENVPLFCLDKYGRETGNQNRSHFLKLRDFYGMKFDFAIEDSPSAFKHFEHFPALKVLVPDRPWNRECVFPNENYTRCSDWDSIRKLVSEQA